MNQYQPLADQIAPTDLIPFQMAQTPVVSGSKILAEIIRMVIELLLAQNLPKIFVRDLRFVSKQFNDLVTPLLYRHTILTHRILLSLLLKEHDIAPHKRQVGQDVREYTQHLTLNGDLPPEHLSRVFESLKCLREVT